MAGNAEPSIIRASNSKHTTLVEQGLVKNFDTLEILIFECAQQCQVNVQETGMFFTEVNYVPKANREKLTQLVFESVQAPGMNVALQGSLVLYARGKETGISIVSGHGVTNFVAIYASNMLLHTQLEFEMAGSHITDKVLQLFKSQAPNMTWESAQALKEQFATVALDYNTEMQQSPSDTFTLPDGTLLQVANERYTCCEALFHPMQHVPELNLQTTFTDAIRYSIIKIDLELRQEMVKHMVFAGGNCMIKGLLERLNLDLCPFHYEKKLGATMPTLNELHLIWQGASALCAVNNGQGLISKEMYDEMGPQVIHKYCTEKLTQ